MNRYRLFGFTLAETLVVLGIFGVVAALVIPSLIAKHQKNVYVTQLKKEYSSLNNNIKAFMASEGVSYLEDSSLLKSMTLSYYDDSADMSDALFESVLKKL